jgi:quercetin dioxygenase-like cupin family protein
MEVLRPQEIEPTIEHEGTCATRFAFPKESMRALTLGTYLEYVSEFSLVGRASLSPHSHNSHEFYYLLEGTATMTIEDEQRDVAAGDLIHIPPNAVHSIAGHDGGFRALAFAVMHPD